MNKSPKKKQKPKRAIPPIKSPQAPRSIPLSSIDIDITLRSGQAFGWRRDSNGIWTGLIGPHPCRIAKTKTAYHITTPAPEAELHRYFGLDLNLDHIHATFPQDEWMRAALHYAAGMRLLAQDPWETTASFICSAVKQVPQIEQISQTLRKTFGQEIAPNLYTFPDAPTLAAAGEAALRQCKLGFRAKNLHRAAQQITAGEINLTALTHPKLETDYIRAELMKLRGVGRKVADCILLFAYRRHEALPIDVWVERIIRELYFKGKRNITPAKLRHFADTYFGPNGGYAQQYLFHWVRAGKALRKIPK